MKYLKSSSPDLLLLMGGVAVSMSGSSLQQAASVMWVTWEYQSPSLNALLGTVPSALALVFGIFFAAAGDRYPRNRLLFVSQLMLFSALSLASLTMGLVPAEESGSMRKFWIVLATLSLSSVMATMIRPAREAVLTTVAPRGRLGHYKSFSICGESAAQMTGQGLAALALKSLGMEVIVFLNAVSFLAASLLHGSVRTARSGAQGSKSGYKSGIREGLRYMMRQPPVVHLCLIFIVINGNWAVVETYLPVLVRESWGLSKEWYATLLTFSTGAYLIGSFLGAKLSQILRSGSLFIWVLIIQHMLLLGVLVVPVAEVRFVLAFLCHLALGAQFVMAFTALQLYIEPGFLARTFGNITVILGASSPLAVWSVGILLERKLVSLEVILLWSVPASLLILFMALFSSELSRLFEKKEDYVLAGD